MVVYNCTRINKQTNLKRNLSNQTRNYEHNFGMAASSNTISLEALRKMMTNKRTRGDDENADEAAPSPEKMATEPAERSPSDSSEFDGDIVGSDSESGSEGEPESESEDEVTPPPKKKTRKQPDAKNDAPGDDGKEPEEAAPKTIQADKPKTSAAPEASASQSLKGYSVKRSGIRQFSVEESGLSVFMGNKTDARRWLVEHAGLPKFPQSKKLSTSPLADIEGIELLTITNSKNPAEAPAKPQKRKGGDDEPGEHASAPPTMEMAKEAAEPVELPPTPEDTDADGVAPDEISGVGALSIEEIAGIVSAAETRFADPSHEEKLGKKACKTLAGMHVDSREKLLEALVELNQHTGRLSGCNGVGAFDIMTEIAAANETITGTVAEGCPPGTNTTKFIKTIVDATLSGSFDPEGYVDSKQLKAIQRHLVNLLAKVNASLSKK